MMKVKVGGMILTGVAAFLVAGRALDTVSKVASNVCEASKWRGYYKCWSKGNTAGEPVAPGYSRTTRPDGADYEIVDDPTGRDHSLDNEPKEEKKHDSTGSVKAVCEALKDISEKVIDSLTKRPEAAEGAKEGQTEALVDDILDSSEEGSDTDGDTDLEKIIDETFWEKDQDDELEKSVEEARKAGVPENDILHNVGEIDEFFTK